VKAFEFSQHLTDKRLTVEYAAKYQILDIAFLNFRLNGVSLFYEMKKPFALLADGLLVSNSGEGGIRTRGTGLTPYTGLANQRIRPLCHLSDIRDGPGVAAGNSTPPVAKTQGVRGLSHPQFGRGA
jgi:hypothetical protein